MEEKQNSQDVKKLWFKAKRYGWGWYPCSWQGWLSLLLYIIAVFSQIYSVSPEAVTVPIVLPYLVSQIFSLTALLIILCYLTGEKPRWRWGK